MSDKFVAEIRMFGFQFAPTGWAFCDGQLLPISQNTALFSLLGTTYGGDGKSTFALPDMQGNAAVHAGQGPGLSLRDLGEEGGTQTVTLLESEMPVHTHNVMSLGAPANRTNPIGNTIARASSGNTYTPPAGAPLVQMAQGSLSPAGGSLPHNNMMPYLTINFCIALQGIFPSRP